jgi:glycosyltransferase involved in cell wall biosynthesis
VYFSGSDTAQQQHTEVSDMTKNPLVSVIIPTYMRPHMCVRAVRTALEQTLQQIEVIVVVDGPGDATVQSLAVIDDRRLRVLVPSTHLGNADARNYGVAASRADHVAFLDDDDLWMPRKLESQMQVADATQYAYPVISCRMIARAESQDFHWPRRVPRVTEPLCEYLFCRRWPFTGEGLIQTSTILTTRQLLGRVAFGSGVRRYVELDWLLRVAQLDGFGIEFPSGDEPLSVWHMEENRTRISNGADFEYSLAWVRERRHLLTSNAYGAFVLWMVSDNAAKERHRGGVFWSLLREARRHGGVRPVDLLTHAANFCLPREIRRRVGAWVAHWRQSSLTTTT